MTKMAHHHPHAHEYMAKAEEWFGRIIVAGAVVGGIVALFIALNSQGHVTW